MSSQTRIATATLFQEVLGIVRSSDIITPELAAEALVRLRDGVITGEGPTTKGRAHFSRTLDAQDAEICAQILLACGRGGDPVTRVEADILFEIDAAAAERHDGGRFDDLFVKAIAHHALAAAGCPVPCRDVALSPATSLESWAPPVRARDVDAEVLKWIAGHVRGKRRPSRALMTVSAFLVGAAALPVVQSLGTLIDLAA